PAGPPAVVDRLGGYASGRVDWGGVALHRVPLTEVRRRILVAEHDAHLFAGPLREALGSTDGGAAAALRVAAAEDIAETLPGGLGAPIDDGARTLSGGQRQRIRLARAVLADPEVLLLADPTSAVDAHTEATIAERLRTARQGRTTLVTTTSPLLLARADAVAFLVDGRLAATGSHDDLLDTEPAYRELVLRGDGTDR
ncbi:ATP-binding cassette domain-containing protein, partial [Pseudonocardia nigra]|uniref:ATP-binding cassette domain-containing protein n=1 Tax=Pseudonocardia nigra TaxID=1921578 RepID=UPI001C5D527D